MSSQVSINHGGKLKLVESFVQSADHLVASGNLINLCKRIADTLDRHYPGWIWAIRPDEGGGIIDIFSMRIDTEYGYTLHTSPLHEDVGLKVVIEAGGEILERYKFPRGPYTYDSWKAGNWRFGKLVPLLTDKERGAQRALHAKTVRQGISTGEIKLLVEHDSSKLGEIIKAHNRK